MKKIINFLIIISTISLGFIRHYIFYNVHYATVYIEQKYPDSYTDSWMKFLDQYSLIQIYWFKWVVSMICIGLTLGLCIAFTKLNFKNIKPTIYLFGAIFGFACLVYSLTFLSLPYTFQISRRALHFIQSPLPLMILFIYHQYVLPLSKNR